MSVININRRFLSQVLQKNVYAKASLPGMEEYTPTPEYPPILDLSREKRLDRKKQVEYDEIKNVKTVEEKQIKLNMPKYYGFKCYMFKEDYIPYNNLHLSQHITRTHLIEQNKLPQYYDSIDVDSVVNSIRCELEDAILMEFTGQRKECVKDGNELDRGKRENDISSSLSKSINRILLNNLAPAHSHLLDAQIDHNPRIESFWFAGGLNPPENIKRHRRAHIWQKHTENDPTDRAVQYLGCPNLTLRSEIPLPAIIQYSESENSGFDVPYFKYDPRVVGTETEFRRAVNIPGFWPGDPNTFSLISYHPRGHHLNREYDDTSDNKEAVHRQGILASFGWLNAQANYLGFTTFNDVTYPLVTQTVITNGQIWSFYVYQLNTLLVHSKNTTENPKRNICWGTEGVKLFEEIQNGKVAGFNDDVLKMLLKFYSNVPVNREGVDLRPFLNKEVCVNANYEDNDKRQWLEREYKFITSNRPRFQLPYELHHWEKIYKVDHNTKPLDARRRPFELFVKPFDRRYDDRQAKYIPRALRPHLPKHVGRYAKEYFP